MSQLSDNGGQRADSPERERLGIAGSGTIAVGLAVCAVPERGGHAVLWARKEDSAQRAREQVERLCAKLEHPAAADRVRVTIDMRDLAESTLAVEAVAEDESLKKAVLGELRGLLAPDALLATTTSSLNVETLARASGDPS